MDCLVTNIITINVLKVPSGVFKSPIFFTRCFSFFHLSRFSIEHCGVFFFIMPEEEKKELPVYPEILNQFGFTQAN